MTPREVLGTGERVDVEDAAQLDAYLEAAGLVERAARRVTEPLSGGVSNKVLLVRVEGAASIVVKQGLRKLRVAADWFSDPERVHQEATALRWLATVIPGASPTLLHEDRANHIIAMTAVPEPHENWKTMLLAGRVDDGHITRFADLLARIHAAGLDVGALPAEFSIRRHFRSLRLEPYYGDVSSKVPAGREFVAALLTDTERARRTVVHGDYSPKNVLVHDGELVLLDHEVMHVGDPGFDLGFALTHLLSKANHLPEHRMAFAAAGERFWREYATRMPAELGGPQEQRQAVRHLSACLLARVEGRSQLEYLTATARRAQRAASLRLIEAAPATVAEAVSIFCEEVG